jgi:hypothetical protein
VSKKKKPTFVPTPEQEEALAKYKAWMQRHGYNWRAQLTYDWTVAGTQCDEVDWAYLQQVRNAPGGMDWAMEDEGTARLKQARNVQKA